MAEAMHRNQLVLVVQSERERTPICEGQWPHSPSLATAVHHNHCPPELTMLNKSR